MKLHTVSALALFASPAFAADLIPYGSTWDYLHPTDAVDPAIADADFDTTWYLNGLSFILEYDGPVFGADPAVVGPPADSGAGPAPLGYGGVTYIDNTLGGLLTELTTPDDDFRGTAYFRHSFEVSSAVDQVALEVMADDGAAIYLDGVLLTTVNFSDPDTYGAFSTVAGIETAPRVILGGLGGLSAGSHTLAVSVHQVNDSSSDLGFDLRLSDDGLTNIPMGTTDFGGAVAPFVLGSDLNGWINTSVGEFLLDNADGGTIRSEAVDISGRGELLFVANFVADETSGNTNFEDDDTFAAWLELDDGEDGVSTISLVPAGLDSEGDGVLAGEEFGPGLEDDLDVVLVRPLVARIPDGMVSATLVVEAINDSTTEMYTLSDAVFTDALPAGTPLGTAELPDASDIPLLLGPGLWSEDDVQIFSLNDADEIAVLISEEVDISSVPQALVTLLLDASETSTNSNFETGDTFQAWVETVDAAGNGFPVQLVDGGADTDGDHILSGDEYAPGVDDAEEVSRQFSLSARLPAGAVSARIVIVAENNAASETFTVSEVLVREAPAIAPEFDILAVALVPGTGVQLTWESEAGAVYDVEFSPDLTAGSFTIVDTVTATGATTTATHDPGAAGEGFYRVSRRP